MTNHPIAEMVRTVASQMFHFVVVILSWEWKVGSLARQIPSTIEVYTMVEGRPARSKLSIGAEARHQRVGPG